MQHYASAVLQLINVPGRVFSVYQLQLRTQYMVCDMDYLRLKRRL